MTSATIGASPVLNILYARRIERQEAGHSFTATSMPGHLLHYVVSGRVTQQCNGRSYLLAPGRVLWYHEDEWVTGTVIEAPWHFYSINFIAPTLPPPAYDARLFEQPGVAVEALFAAVIEAWEDEALAPTARLLRVHAGLSGILGSLTGRHRETLHIDAPARLWWKLETQVRRDLSRNVNLGQLEAWSGASAATIARSAQAAVGMPPMRRIKAIRLSLARGLVQRSDLSLSQIAERVGYGRLNEFSRDYRRYFGVAPSHDRGAR